MNRKKAWSIYFETGERTPLIKAYWDSINYIAWQRYPHQQEDMFQIGMMGLLKAIDRVDVGRVKSLDAWVFLNVRGMMFNARQFPPTESLDAMVNEDTAYVDLIPSEDEYSIGDLLKDLPKREALIVRLLHVEDYNRVEVGKMFGLSSMRIGQLEKRALDKLAASW